MSSDYDGEELVYDPDSGVVYDEKTGEVIEHLRALNVAVPKRGYRGKNYIYAMQPDFKRVAKMDIRGASLRLLMWMAGEMGFQNTIACSQKAMAEELDMHKSTVSTSIKELIDRDLLIKDRKIGTSWTYRINANLCWKGKIKLRDDMAEEHPALFPEKNGTWGEA